MFSQNPTLVMMTPKNKVEAFFPGKKERGGNGGSERRNPLPKTTVKKTFKGVPWWPRGQDSVLSLQQPEVQFLAWELRSYIKLLHIVAKKEKKKKRRRRRHSTFEVDSSWGKAALVQS